MIDEPATSYLNLAERKDDLMTTETKKILPTFFDDFSKGLSLDRVMRDTRWLVEQIPDRLSGTPGADKAAAYLKKQLEDEGIEVTLDQVPGFVSIPEFANLEITAPDHTRFEVWPFAHSGSTTAPIEGQLVYLGSGGESDYEGVDVRGKIVLVELSYAPPRPEKVRLATYNGAIGVIMMNWGPDDSHLIPYGTCKPVWGNPEPDDMRLMPTLPAVGIARRDGVRLRELTKKEPVRVVLESRTSRKWHVMSQPRAVIKAPEGQNPNREFLIICGHMDSWPVGATDNANGNALVLEVVRNIYRVRDQLRRDVWVLFWQGHENGIMAGSTWFVDHFWDDLRDRAVGHINVDSPGMLESTIWLTNSSSELVPFHTGVEKVLLGNRPSTRGRAERTGDQSFFGIGVPSMTARTTHTPEQVKSWNGAILGTWYHSSDDTMDKVDEQLMGVALEIIGGYVVSLATVLVLPYDFQLPVEEIANRLDELQVELKQQPDLSHSLELAAVRENCQRLLDLTREVAAQREEFDESDPRAVAHWNSVVLEATRLLIPIKHTVRGRYGQDPYGLSATKRELSGLHPLSQLARMNPEGDDARQLYTSMRRQRNRINDALLESMRVLSRLL